MPTRSCPTPTTERAYPHASAHARAHARTHMRVCAHASARPRERDRGEGEITTPQLATQRRAPHFFMRTKLECGTEMSRNGGTPKYLPSRQWRERILIEKRCLYCGKKYLAKTKRSRYCSDRCRKAANREMIVISKAPNTITVDTIAKSAVIMRGDAAFFDAAAQRGPVKYRKACRDISETVIEKLAEWGL